MDKEQLLEEINNENWQEILNGLSDNSDEIKEFFRDNEEKILDKIFQFPANTVLAEKRKRYVYTLLESGRHFSEISDEKYQKIYNEIEEIRGRQGTSILEFEEKPRGNTHIVFALGNRIIKFGKYFEIKNDPNILQPEFSLMLDNDDNTRMTVFERIEPLEIHDDEATQIMYNKLRHKGILWFEANGNNMGITTNLRDENDDGLRIIDAEYMENTYDIMEMLETTKNEYNHYGQLDTNSAFSNYISRKGYSAMESKYRQACLNNTLNAKYGIKKVVERSSISRLEKVKNFFKGLFLRKEIEK